MKILKPKKLEKGDTIGFLSVAGNISDFSKIYNAKKYFENLGYKVIVSDTNRNNDFYLCDSDNNRANALNSFFENPEIKMIITTRGGYGSIKILDKINYTVVKNNPKIFIGYSDITALLSILYKKTGLVSFHGANVINTFGKNFNPFNEKSFWNIFEKEQKEFVSENNKTYFDGISTGILFGGNLSTISSLAGLEFFPEEKFILFLEDLNEPVYKIDKMITQLLNIKEFRKNISGLILGDFLNIDNEEYFEKLLINLADELKIPMCKGFKISHANEQIVLPIGVKCEFSSTNGTLKILENYFE